MKLYIKDNVLKSFNKITLIKDGMQIFNPTEEMILEDGWVEWGAPELIPQQQLEATRNIIIDRIKQYDSSDEVNMFYINNIPVWLDKSTRTGLILRFEAEKANGRTDTVLWYNSMQFPLNIDAAKQILYQIELYASKCYDNTQFHISEVAKLSTIEDLEAYDYTIGYPDKLTF